jgi:hypothetical protein
MATWNALYNHFPVCVVVLLGISSGYILFFKGQMESRMDYNHPSVCRSRHARFL